MLFISSFPLSQYYLKAISSPWGQRVRVFYTDTFKQVQDIHEEARRIVEHEKAEKNEKLSASKQTTQDTSAAGSASEPEIKNTPVK